MRPEDIVVNKKDRTVKTKPAEKPALKTEKPASKAPAAEAPKEGPKKKKHGSSETFKKISKKVSRYQAPIIIILIGALLAITALRMMRYASPLSDDQKVQENLSKFKKINIDKNTVERIKGLKDTQATTGTSVES